MLTNNKNSAAVKKQLSDMHLLKKNLVAKQSKMKSMVNVLEFKNRMEKVDLVFQDHESYEMASSISAAQNPSQQHDQMQSNRSKFNSEVDFDEADSELQSNNSMESELDEDDEE